MPDLIVRPSPKGAKRQWCLQLRYHDCCGPTDYTTLCYLDDTEARDVVRAGRAYWLYGDPDGVVTPPQVDTPTVSRHGPDVLLQFASAETAMRAHDAFEAVLGAN